MGIKSINEPTGPGRTSMVTPRSINEPGKFPAGEIPKPTVAGVEPSECVLGSAGFRIYVSGTNFFTGSIIVFADYDEPTTLEDDGRLSTAIDMSVWHGPDTVPVAVRNADVYSNEVEFTFNAPEGDTTKSPPRR
jgi:hypothetical protein